VNSIQSAMLVALGFLVAALFVLVVMPAYRRRVERLTTDTIKRAMPLTDAEIRADKDRLRAEYAIGLFRLERKVEDSTLAAARQMIELNRRDAAISRLEGEVGELRTSLDEHANARRVLEQTLTDRLPRVEHRLSEAKGMLLQRDREIASLTQTSATQAKALEEATQINIQQRDEIQRLGAALTTRAARNRESVADTRFDGEVALRSEIEALRAKTRDQASLIARLQAVIARPGSTEANRSAEAAAPQAETTDVEMARQAAEIASLQRALSEAEARLKSSERAVKAAASVVDPALEAELKKLRTEKRDAAAELASLRAANAAYEKAAGDEGPASTKDSRLALKAKLSALQAQTDEQTQTIQSLRAEVASANERMARQAAHFRDEMRRLGAGTVQTSGEPTRRPESPARRSLTSRISEPRVARIGAVAERPAPAAAANAASEDKPRAANGGGGRLKAVEGGAKVAKPTSAPAKGSTITEKVGEPEQPRSTAAPEAATPGPRSGEPPDKTGERRSRLMDRIMGLDKSSA